MDAAQYIERNRESIADDWRRLVRERAGPDLAASTESTAEVDQVIGRLAVALETTGLEAQRRELDRVMDLSAAMARRWMDRGVDFEDAYRGVAAIRWSVWNVVQRGVFDMGLLTLRDLVTVGRLLNRFVDTMLMQVGLLYIGSSGIAATTPPVDGRAVDLAEVEAKLEEALLAVRRVRERLENA